MAGGSKFVAPGSAASVLFPKDPEWPKDHVFFIEELSKNGVKPEELLLVDLHGKPGWYVVTLSCPAVRDRIAASGVRIAGKDVYVIVGGSQVTVVSLFGCPLHLHDGALINSLEAHGKVFGQPTRKTVKHGDYAIETGTRQIRISLQKGVPSTLRVGSVTVRTWYPGQVQTCYLCTQTGHEARYCPTRKNSNQAYAGAEGQSSQTQATPNTHAGEKALYSQVTQGQSNTQERHGNTVANTNESAEGGQQEKDASTPGRGEIHPTEPKGKHPLDGISETSQQENDTSSTEQNEETNRTYASTVDERHHRHPDPNSAEQATGDESLPQESRSVQDEQQSSVDSANPPQGLQQQQQQASTPVAPSLPPPSRGKAAHSSPDEEGFTLASGKHTFAPHVLTPTQLTPEQQPAFNVDIQQQWAKQASAKEMADVAKRVAASHRRHLSK